jgi:hypothetical protein
VSHLLFRRYEPRSTQSHAILLIMIPGLLSNPVSYSVRSPYTALPLVFALYWSGLVFFTLAYRLSPFHPLAKYPGPVLAKSSKLWSAYLSAIGDQHRCYKRLHDCYGDVVRIGSRQHPPSSIRDLFTYPFPGPNELSVLDPSFIHPVLGQGGLPKGPRAYGSSSLANLPT